MVEPPPAPARESIMFDELPLSAMPLQASTILSGPFTDATLFHAVQQGKLFPSPLSA